MIEVILFDLGNVILPFSHFQIAEKLSRFSRKKEFQDPAKVFSYLFDFQSGAVNLFDLGKVSPEEFFQSIKEYLNLSLDFDVFVPIWNEIFTEDLEVSKTILALKGKWRLGLLSNTDILHFNYIISKFPVLSAFDKWILSYEAGFKKPDLRIFRKALEWASVKPEGVLFIDDIETYVETARSLGMQGIHFRSASQMKEDLAENLRISLKTFTPPSQL